MNKRSAFRLVLIDLVRAHPGLRAGDYVLLLWREAEIDKSPATILSALSDLEAKGILSKEREPGWYVSKRTPWNWRIRA